MVMELMVTSFPKRLLLPLFMRDKSPDSYSHKRSLPGKCKQVALSAWTIDQCCHFSFEDNRAVSPANRKAEFLKYTVSTAETGQSIICMAPGVRCHAEVSVCFCFSNKATAVCAAPLGLSPHRSFLPSCLPSSPFLPPVLTPCLINHLKFT